MSPTRSGRPMRVAGRMAVLIAVGLAILLTESPIAGIVVAYTPVPGDPQNPTEETGTGVTATANSGAQPTSIAVEGAVQTATEGVEVKGSGKAHDHTVVNCDSKNADGTDAPVEWRVVISGGTKIEAEVRNWWGTADSTYRSFVWGSIRRECDVLPAGERIVRKQGSVSRDPDSAANAAYISRHFQLMTNPDPLKPDEGNANFVWPNSASLSFKVAVIGSITVRTSRSEQVEPWGKVSITPAISITVQAFDASGQAVPNSTGTFS
jgi:hypothetical protein